jgi:hypothetical protein
MANTPTRSIRIPDDLWSPAVAIAAARGTTVTAVVLERLEEYVAEWREAAPSEGQR